MIEVPTPPPHPGPGRVWYGMGTGAGAWLLAGAVDAIVAWEACTGRKAGGVFTSTGEHWLLGIVTFGLLAATVVAGVMAVRNWRQLGGGQKLIYAEASGRKEFQALVGLIVSVSLGVGLVWFALPIYLLASCVRVR